MIPVDTASTAFEAARDVTPLVAGADENAGVKPNEATEAEPDEAMSVKPDDGAGAEPGDVPTSTVSPPKVDAPLPRPDPPKIVSIGDVLGVSPARPDLIENTERTATPPGGGRLITREELLARGSRVLADAPEPAVARAQARAAAEGAAVFDLEAAMKLIGAALGKGYVGRSRRFLTWITLQGWTPATMPSNAVERYLATVTRDSISVNLFRRLVEKGPTFGVPFAPQVIGPTPPAPPKKREPRMNTEPLNGAEAPPPANGATPPAPPPDPRDFFPPASPPTVAAPTPGTAVVNLGDLPRAKRAAPGQAAGPSHHAAPKLYLVELLNDGVIVPGLGPGRPVEIDTYPESALGDPPDVNKFLRETVLPYIAGVRPGSPVRFNVVELNDRRVRTGRVFEPTIFAKPGPGGATFQPPVAPLGGPSLPPTPPPADAAVDLVRDTAAQLLRKQLMDNYDLQRSSIQEQAKGDPAQLYNLMRELDRRHDDMLRKIEAAERRVEEAHRRQEEEEHRRAALPLPPPIVVPAPTPQETMAETLVSKYLARQIEKEPPTARAQLDDTMALLEAIKRLTPTPPPAAPAENAMVAELRAELAAMRAEREAEKREGVFRSEIADLRAEIAKLGSQTNSLDGAVAAVSKVHDAAQQLGIARDDDGDDDSLLALALKNPTGTAQILQQFVAILQMNRGPTATPAQLAAPQPAPAQLAAPQPVPTAPLAPPPAATAATAELDQLALEPDDGDEFSEDRVEKIAQTLLSVLGAWQAGDPGHQAQAQVFLMALRDARVFPDIYHVVKRVGAVSGHPMRHAAVNNVAGLLHAQWSELTTFLFGTPCPLDDADEVEGEGEGEGESASTSPAPVKTPVAAAPVAAPSPATPPPPVIPTPVAVTATPPVTPPAPLAPPATPAAALPPPPASPRVRSARGHR